MAKKSMIARENKRTRTVAKYAAKRAALKAILGRRMQPLMRKVGCADQAAEAAS